MNIAELFIRRPIMTTLVMTAILIFGILGYRQLPVSVSETTPETRIAIMITTANSCSSRPMIPCMKSTGMKTATSERVMERIVNPISRDPLSAASMEPSPISMCRTTFSSITIASSTTKPTESVSAMSDRLSTV